MTNVHLLIAAVVFLHICFSFATASIMNFKSGGYCYTPMWMLYCLFFPYVAYIHFSGWNGIWCPFYLMFVNPFVQLGKKVLRALVAFGV